jgi:hypothetical protein
MTEDTVYEIDINKKYILVIPKTASSSDVERAKDAIKAWLASDDMPFLIIREGVRLVDDYFRAGYIRRLQ